MNKVKSNTVEQPSNNEQQILNSLLEGEITYVNVRGHKWKAAPLYNGTLRKMTNVILKEENEDMVAAKCAALFRLNGFFMIHLFYWILWRYMYYIKEYRNAELFPYIVECKKKVELAAYYGATISLIEMKDTKMAMTREEVEHIQAAQAMEQLGRSQKNSTESQSQNISLEES